MAKNGKIESNGYKHCKFISVSSSDSYTDYSVQANWERTISNNGILFYAKYMHKNRDSDQNPEGAFNLAAVKNAAVKEVDLIVSSLHRYRFGRRSSIVESMLGFEVIPFSDNIECLMVANIIDHSIKLKYPYIKVGDWFKSLENIEVRAGNVEKLLLQYTKSTKVKLVFKGSYHKTREETVFREINNYNDFAYAYKRLFQCKSSLLEQKGSVFLTLIISREHFKSDSTECIFYYPYIPSNFLYKSRGSFLTLDSVVNNDFKTKSTQSTIIVECTKYYIIYGHIDSKLVVCAFSAHHQSKMAAKSYGTDFISFLKFNISELNALKIKQYLTHVCDIMTINIENNRNHYSYNLNLSSCLNSSLYLSLPKEAQLRIYDALSELESMDCKKWNESEENLRDLIVCGSALYYKNYLIASNLPVGFKINLECFLRQRGILEFVVNININEMYIWENVEQLDTISKHFLAICIQNSLLLVVVLKSTPLTKPRVSCIPYMEEITDTVTYLTSCGIDSIAQFWVDSNKRPSINSNKSNTHMPYKFRFLHQKDNSPENIDINTSLCNSPISLSQSEEGCKKNSESENTLDWQVFPNKNECRELEQNCHYVDPLLNEVRSIIPFNLTAGWSNDLKYFLHLNFSDGTILLPFKPMCSDLELAVIRENIIIIHEILQLNTNSKKMQDIASSSNKNVMAVKEHSITVDIVNSSGNKESIVIIGRLFSFPLKEVYICFEQNISQNLVEQSFRMSFLNIG